TKDSTFTLKLEAELRDAFIAAAEAEDRPASQVVRDLMRQYIAERDVTPEYRDFLQKKVDRARDQMRQGLGRASSEVEKDFAKVRENWA
ncbi:MAG TPA: antitoxin of toxin-antitoxin stability system, partial [Ochrobactrum sp.]|nr:antitoxin of toxin-antitoxin stability system [Ochrobactrum sp.]